MTLAFELQQEIKDTQLKIVLHRREKDEERRVQEDTSYDEQWEEDTPLEY